MLDRGSFFHRGVLGLGGVHHAHVLRSSGSSLLDRDALAWLARAQPLPPPPPEIAGALIPIAVPLRYKAR